MNKKIVNYVEVLFSDIPMTLKAKELKEEILSNLNDHFEAHLSEGMSETQAYTEAIRDLGDIDVMLKGIMPNRDIQEKIDNYNHTYARNTAISVVLYILSAAFLIGMAAFPAISGTGDEAIFALIGFIGMLVIVAAATGLIIYTNTSMPQEIGPYIRRKNKKSYYDTSTKGGRIMKLLMDLFNMITVIVYLIVSFATEGWAITWLIFLIAEAIKIAIRLIYNVFAGEKNE